MKSISKKLRLKLFENTDHRMFKVVNHKFALNVSKGLGNSPFFGRMSYYSAFYGLRTCLRRAKIIKDIL